MFFYFRLVFPYVLFVLHHDHKPYGVAMAMLIEFVHQALCAYGICVSGSGPWCLGLRSPTLGARRKMTSKNMRTEHVYFSDSNDFVWKRVNTITVTTELRGFEGLTLHCFPRERVETAEDQGQGPEDPGGFVCFHFLLRNAFM